MSSSKKILVLCQDIIFDPYQIWKYIKDVKDENNIFNIQAI